MQRIQELLKKPTSVHIIINTVGNYINVFFTAVFTLVLVRILSPTEYGTFGVLTSISYVMANILDFGTTATIYSYLPPLIEDKSRSMYRFVKSTFFYQTIFSSVVVSILLLMFPLIDSVFFKTDAPYIDLALSALSIMFFIWQNFLLNIYFAAKKFLKANSYLNISNIIKGVMVFLAYLTGTVSITSMQIIFGIVGPLVFYLLVLRDRKDDIHHMLKSDVNREDFRFKYTLTYFIASQFLNIGLRMDLFLMSYYRAIITRPEVGFYSLAQKIILTILTTIVSITQVLSPSFSKIATQTDARRELKHGLVYMLLPSALFVGVALTPNFIYELFFTPEFVQSAIIAKLLSLPYILYAMGSVPMLFMLYTVKKPKVILYAYTIFFLIISVGCYVLIPVYKLYAPPLIFLVGFLVSSGIIGWSCYQEYKKLPVA